jgi:TolB protein
MRPRVIGMTAALLVALAAPGAAQTPTEVRLDISSGGQRIRIHCEPLRADGDRGAATASVEVDRVLANDFDLSGAFAVSRAWVSSESVDGAQATIGGQWTVHGSQVRLSGEVRDVPGGKPILLKEYRGAAADWRAIAHRFADEVVLQFTGELGVSSTRISFVAQQGRDKELYVMDLDGARLQALTADHSIALSPAWSPEGSLLLFTSYRSNTGPQLWVMYSIGGKPYLVSGRPGINTSASYSPDGRDIACTLSLDGNPEIYVLDARGGSPRRLTSARGIDTSPCWSPTGREIAFTSDRGGSPQVYVMDRDGGNVRRLTYDVSYTDSPAWSPRGDRIAFVVRSGGGFDLWVAGADGQGARPLVSGGSNENPRWSPDGRHLVFSSNRDGGRGLYVTDLDDRPPRRLDTGGLVASTPAWSPRFGIAGGSQNLTPNAQHGR